MPVILATQEAEIRRISVQSQPRQIALKTLSRLKKRKKTSQKKAGGMAQDVGPEFKPQYCKKKRKKGKKYRWKLSGLLMPVLTLLTIGFFRLPNNASEDGSSTV
jgi:hypothetical protein